MRIQGSSASLSRSACSLGALTTSMALCLRYFSGPPSTTNRSASSVSMNAACSVHPFCSLIEWLASHRGPCSFITTKCPISHSRPSSTERLIAIGCFFGHALVLCRCTLARSLPVSSPQTLMEEAGRNRRAICQSEKY